MTEQRTLTRADVLDAFAVEADPAHALPRYLREYPQYEAELRTLLWLMTDTVPDESPLSADDRTMIDAAWERHRSRSHD